MVSWSSTELEYMALDDLLVEVAWIISLLGDLQLLMPQKLVLHCDNLSAKTLASNLVMHARSKNIEIDVCYIRDQALQNEINIAYVPTTDQITNCLTKPLTHTNLGVTMSPSVCEEELEKVVILITKHWSHYQWYNDKLIMEDQDLICYELVTMCVQLSRLIPTICSLYN